MLFRSDDTRAAPLVLDVRPFVDSGWARPRPVVGGVVGHSRGWVGCPAFEGREGPGGLMRRVEAFAWDEGVGRLVVAEEGSSVLRVYDFAAAPWTSEWWVLCGCAGVLTLFCLDLQAI